jgi:hypothetical protein
VDGFFRVCDRYRETAAIGTHHLKFVASMQSKPPQIWKTGPAGPSVLSFAIFARAFSSESLPRTWSGVDTGSREENASKPEPRAPFRFYRNGKGSGDLMMLTSDHCDDMTELFLSTWFFSRFNQNRQAAGAAKALGARQSRD